VATLFFDSSGLVKRYVAEIGTAWVQSLNAPTAGHDRVIAQITGAEMIAAITRRLRRGDIAPADAATAISDIEADFANDYFLLETSLARIREAMMLARIHGLRGYDAVQLASALFLRDQCRTLGQPDPIFITADKELTAAAIVEGLAVDDPNTHP
jgi:predicted nucleic acid-binding protein